MADLDARHVVRHHTVVALMHKEASGRHLTDQEKAALVEARKTLRRERVDLIRRGAQRG